MPVSFAEMLVVGISSRVLFDLEEENKLFNDQGIVEYRKLQKEREEKILSPGTGFHLSIHIF
jgi:5'-nucleotidase